MFVTLVLLIFTLRVLHHVCLLELLDSLFYMCISFSSRQVLEPYSSHFELWPGGFHSHLNVFLL